MQAAARRSTSSLTLAAAAACVALADPALVALAATTACVALAGHALRRRRMQWQRTQTKKAKQENAHARAPCSEPSIQAGPKQCRAKITSKIKRPAYLRQESNLGPEDSNLGALAT